MPDDKDAFIPIETALSVGMASYIATLTRQGTRSLAFHTGAGHLYRDLLLNWPIVENWEDHAQTLCKKITAAVYPLAKALFAQSLEIAVVISPKPIEAPAHVEALSTYVIFDTQRILERQFFLSPEHPLPNAGQLNTPKGIVVFCRPLNYRYHTQKDGHTRPPHPQVGMYELTERQINALHERYDFIATDKAALNRITTNIEEATLSLEDEALLDDAQELLTNNLTDTLHTGARFSALPLSARAIEEILLSRSVDGTLSPSLRLELRRMAQSLHDTYPQVIVKIRLRNKTGASAYILPSSPQPTEQEAQGPLPLSPDIQQEALALAAVLLVPHEDEIAQPVMEAQTEEQPFAGAETDNRWALEKRAHDDAFYGRLPDPILYNSGLLYYRNAYDATINKKQHALDGDDALIAAAALPVIDALIQHSETVSAVVLPAQSVLAAEAVSAVVLPIQSVLATVAASDVVLPTQSVLPTVAASTVVLPTQSVLPTAAASTVALPTQLVLPTEALLASTAVAALPVDSTTVPAQTMSPAMAPATTTPSAVSDVQAQQVYAPQNNATAQQSASPVSTQPDSTMTSAPDLENHVAMNLGENTGGQLAGSAQQGDMSRGELSRLQKRIFSDAPQTQEIRTASLSEPARPFGLQQGAATGESLTFPPSSGPIQHDVHFVRSKEMAAHPLARHAIERPGSYTGLETPPAPAFASTGKLNPEDLLNLQKSIISQSVLTQSPLWASTPIAAILATSTISDPIGRGKRILKNKTLLAARSEKPPATKFPTPEPFPPSPTIIKT